MFSQILTFLIFFLLINDFLKTNANSLSQSQEIDIFSLFINLARVRDLFLKNQRWRPSTLHCVKIKSFF